MQYTHEVWEDPAADSVTFICVAAPWAKLNRHHLSPHARIIGTFEAGSLLDAFIRFHRFMGWEEYKPSDLDDADPYPDDRANPRDEMTTDP